MQRYLYPFYGELKTTTAFEFFKLQQNIYTSRNSFLLIIHLKRYILEIVLLAAKKTSKPSEKDVGGKSPFIKMFLFLINGDCIWKRLHKLWRAAFLPAPHQSASSSFTFFFFFFFFSVFCKQTNAAVNKPQSNTSLTLFCEANLLGDGYNEIVSLHAPGYPGKDTSLPSLHVFRRESTPRTGQRAVPLSSPPLGGCWGAPHPPPPLLPLASPYPFSSSSFWQVHHFLQSPLLHHKRKKKKTQVAS